MLVSQDTQSNISFNFINMSVSLLKSQNLSLQNCFSTLNSRRPLHLMMTPVCPRLLNLNNDFVLLRFWARAPEDLSAIEVIYIIIIIIIIYVLMLRNMGQTVTFCVV